MIARYAAQDARIRVVLNEQNSSSTFKQWNKGFALAKGDYLWLGESNNFASLYFLETLLTHIETDEQVVLVCKNSFDINEYGSKISSYITDNDEGQHG